MNSVRKESDSIGSLDMPSDAYWGVNTARALQNFPIIGRTISVYPDLIGGYACVKQAAARAAVGRSPTAQTLLRF